MTDTNTQQGAYMSLPEPLRTWLTALQGSGPAIWWPYVPEEGSSWAFILSGGGFSAIEVAPDGSSRVTTVPTRRVSLIQETRVPQVSEAGAVGGYAIEVAIEVDGGAIVGAAEGVERYETKIGPFAEDGSQDAAGGAQQRVNFELSRHRYTLRDDTETATQLAEFAAALRTAINQAS